MNYGNLLKAVEACREPYRYVVIDAPRVPESVIADLASLSYMILVVFQLTVRDVSFARSRISFLSDHGIASDRILPVANRVGRRGPLLRVKESKRAIGVTSLCWIRNDWTKAVKSLNQGRPLAEMAGRSRLRRDFLRLAGQICNWTPNNKP
jgi:Flp pilus assembly CpaE family ATPase